MSADPLAHVVQGWPRFRRYAPRMLRALEIQASGAGEHILAALRAIGGGSRDMPRTFLRRNSAAIRGGISISTLAAGVEFRFLSEDFDTPTATGKLQLAMVLAFSEW